LGRGWNCEIKIEGGQEKSTIVLSVICNVRNSKFWKNKAENKNMLYKNDNNHANFVNFLEYFKVLILNRLRMKIIRVYYTTGVDMQI